QFANGPRPARRRQSGHGGRGLGARPGGGEPVNTQESAVRRGLLALLVVWVAGCALPGQPDPKDREKTPDEVRDFATLYRQNCAGCHGADGKNGPAPPLNDPLFLAIVPDNVLRELVAHGRKDTLMPGFGGRQPIALLQPGKAVIQQG